MGDDSQFSKEFVQYRQFEFFQTGWFVGQFVLLVLAHVLSTYTFLSFGWAAVTSAFVTCLLFAVTDSEERHVEHAAEEKRFKQA